MFNLFKYGWAGPTLKLLQLLYPERRWRASYFSFWDPEYSQTSSCDRPCLYPCGVLVEVRVHQGPVVVFGEVNQEKTEGKMPKVMQLLRLA